MPPPDQTAPEPASPDDILGPSIATAPPTPTAVPPADPSDILDDTDRFKVATFAGLEQEPARAARLLRAQARTGLPTVLIDPHLDQVEQALRVQDFDADKFRRESPLVAQAIAENPALAGLARDDLLQLANVERLIRFDPRYSYTPGGQIVEDLGNGLGHVHQSLREFRDALVSQGVAADVAQRRSQEISDAFGPTQAVSAGFVGSVAATLHGLGASGLDEGAGVLMQASQESHPGLVGDLLRSAGSAAADIPTLAIPGGGLAKAVQGVAEARGLSMLAQHLLTGAASMQGFALRDAAIHAQDGDFGQALAAWAADTGIAGAFGPVGASRFFMRAGGEQTAAQAATGGAALVLKQAGLNAGQNAAFALSDAIQRYASGEDPHALDAERLGPALASAGVFGAGLGALFSTPEAWAHVKKMKDLAGNQAYQRVAAMATAQRLGEIAKQADDMQALELNQPAVQTLVQRLAESGSDIKTLYLDAQAVRDHFAPTVDTEAGAEAKQQPKPTAREWVGQVTGDPVAYDKAIASGQQIAVPIESFFANVARSEHRDWFLSEARRLPGAQNDREAVAGWKADGDKARAEAQGQINSPAPDEVAAKADEVRQSADLVSADVERQLVAAGVPAGEAKRNAQVWGAFFHTTAQRFKAEGVALDPWTLYQGKGLTVERGTAEDAARPPSDGTLDQRLEVPSAHLRHEYLLKEWKKAHGDRSPTPTDRDWQKLVKQADMVDAAQGRSFEQPGDQAPRARIRVGDTSTKISLFEGHDRSSFMHETGHFLLEMMHDLGDRADAPAALKGDLTSIRDWLGAKDTEKLTREQHEQFAEGWETYLMKGQAPSTGLRAAFARLTKWLTEIYKSIANRVQLPQAVHDVMDRLIATESEIKEARQEEAPPLFDDQATFNGNEKEWSEYIDTIAKAKQRAHDILEAEMMQRIRDEEGADYQEELAKVRDHVEQIVAQIAPYRAIDALRGVGADGLPIKLSRREIVERYGRTSPEQTAEQVAEAGQVFLDRLPGPQREGDPKRANRGTTIYSDSEHAVGLNDAAEQFGFSSGDALYKALAGAADRNELIESETQKEMDRRRPDPFNDGSARERARLALANKDRLRVMEMEAKALASRTGRMPTESDLLKAVAQSEIDKTQSFRINPEVHRVAMQKAGKAAAKAMAEAKHATDPQAKQRWLVEAQANKSREILSYHLYRMASFAQKAEEKGGEYLSTFDKLDKRERLGKSGGETWVVRWEDPATRQPQSQEFTNQAAAVERAKSVPGGDVERSGYLEQIDGLMEQVSLRRPSNAQLQRRESLRDFIRRKSEDGDALVMSDDLVNDLGTKHWRELTVAQQRNLVDAVKNLEKQANQQNRLLTTERKQRLDEAVKEAVDTIKANKPKEIPRKVGGGITDAPRDAFARYLAAHRKVASLLYEADGFKYGTLYDLWQRPLNDAFDRELAMVEKDSAAWSGLIKEWGKVRPADPFSLNWRRYEPSVGVELNHWAKIMVALNWGNAGNRERLMKGYGWSEAQVEGLIDTLDKKDMEFVQGTLDLVNSHWQDIKAKVERVTGIAPEKVESLPIITRHGVFRGGYFPAKYDPRTLKGKDPALDEQASITKMGERLWSTTARGHTKARTDAPEGAQVWLVPSVITQHLNQVVHDLAFHETLIDLNRVLRHDDFRDTVMRHMGDGAFRQMKTQLRDVAAGVQGSETGLDKLLEYTRQGVNFAARGFNLATGLQQVAGLPQVLVRVGPKYFAKALARMFTDGDSLDNGVHFAEEKSIALRNRSKTFDKNISDATSGVGLRGPLRKTIDGAGYYFWTKAFQVLDAHTWLAGYLKAMDEEPLAGATAEQHEARAISIADQVVTDIQGSGAAKDLPAIMRGGPLAQVFTSNMSWWLANYNLTAESINRAKSGRIADIARTGADLFVLYGVMTAAWAALDAALTGRDADAWKDPLSLAKKLGEDAAYTAASSMVLLRDLADTLSAGKEYKGPAGLKSLQYIADTISGVWHAAHDHASEAEDEAAREKLMRSSIRTVGVLFHLPSRMLLQMLDAVNAPQQPGGPGPARTLLFGAPPKVKP